MKTQTRRVMSGLAALLVTVGAMGVTWWNHRAPRVVNEAMHRGVGERLAEEVAALVGPTGQLVVVTLNPGCSDVLDLQHAAFRRRLEAWPGVRIVRTDEVDGTKGDKYGPGTGLSARRLQRLAAKETGAGAIVSFLGVPDAEDLPAGSMPVRGPVLIAFSRSPKGLAPLIERGLLARAIVPRFTFPAPGPENPRGPAEWFDNRFQVVKPAAPGPGGAG